MNNGINGTAGMSQDTTMAQSNGYANENWTNISPYNSQSPYGNSPLNEYGAFPFLAHGLPSESLNRMPPPPPQQHQHQQHQQQHHQHQAQQTHHQMIQPAPPSQSPGPTPMGHQQLPLLNTTMQPTWPSQLTNPTPQGSYSAPPLSITPVTSATPVETQRLPAQHEKARKTLSDEQKRAMCMYHEENPGTRQADIGAKFGVERRLVLIDFLHKCLV